MAKQRVVQVPGSTAATVAASPGGAVRSANVTTITTTAAHGFVVGTTVVQAGITPVGLTVFNGTKVIASVPSPTTYTYADVAADDTGGGGTTTPQFLDIACTMAARHMTVSECPDSTGTFSPQGLEYKRHDDPSGTPYAATFNAGAGEDINIGNPIAEGNGYGPLIGGAAQNTVGDFNYRAAHVPVKVISQTATATQVLVSEID